MTLLQLAQFGSDEWMHVYQMWAVISSAGKFRHKTAQTALETGFDLATSDPTVCGEDGSSNQSQFSANGAGNYHRLMYSVLYGLIRH
jgi:hypothetical protein